MRKTNLLSAFLCTFLVLVVSVFSATDVEARQSKKPPKKQKCASGIINPATNQCWICSKESRDPIRLRVEKAKKESSALGSCDKKMNFAQLQERQRWWTELNIARGAENRCWTPEHSAHKTEEKKALAVANNCDSLIKELEKKK